MKQHPSITAPLVEPDPIIPVETMGLYKPCWCRSGVKYKWCHYRREKQPSINIFEVEAQMLAEFRKGYCSYPAPSTDPCSDIITKAHTIQKNGGLSAIAEHGHVLTVKPSMKAIVESNGNPAPRKIGINNASVFPGFCSKHDDQIFKPIEGKSVSLTKDTAFLLAYRAIAYECFSKEAQLKFANIQRDLDKGRPFPIQAIIQTEINAYISGINIGRRDVQSWKTKFDERLLSGAREDFHFLSVRFDKVLPIVACTAFHPEFDMQGNRLQSLGRDWPELDHITLTVTAFNSKTIMFFGWIGNAEGPAKALATSFAAASDERKADALIRLLFSHTDNLFLTPSWWDNMQIEDQEALKAMMKSGTTVKARSGVEIADETRSLIAAAVVETANGL